MHGFSDVSVRKISASRLTDYDGPRRAKPRLNLLKRDRSSLLAAEERLLEAILHDDNVRAAIDGGMGRAREPMSVWVDSDQSWNETLLQPCELPEWETMSERMKMFIGFDVGMEFGWSFAFTAKISPALVNKWTADGSDLVANVQQRMKRCMAAKGISDMPICWVIEARTKSGKSRNKPHLHGVALCEDALLATKLKVALELALAVGLDNKERRKAVQVKRAYIMSHHPMGKFRWVSYITKNAHLYDQRFGKRRIYISRSFTQIARLAWAVRRDDCCAA